MAQYNLPSGGVSTWEPHETSNTPPGDPDPSGQPIGPLPDYGTAVPDQGGSLVDRAKAAIEFLQNLPAEVTAELQEHFANQATEASDVAGGAPTETADTAGSGAGDAAPAEPTPAPGVASNDEAPQASNEPVPAPLSEGAADEFGGSATAPASTDGADEVHPELPPVQGADVPLGAEVTFRDGGMTTTDDGDSGRLADSLKAVEANPSATTGDSSPIVDQSALSALNTELQASDSGDQTPS